MFAGYGHARTQLMGCMEYFRASVSIYEIPERSIVAIDVHSCAIIFTQLN